MSWRNQTSHREETYRVKQALISAGIDVKKVTHGKGTAWAWLHITIHKPLEFGCDIHGTHGSYEDRLQCTGCRKYYQSIREIDHKAIVETQKATGRHGEYSGEILVNFD